MGLDCTFPLNGDVRKVIGWEAVAVALEKINQNILEFLLFVAPDTRNTDASIPAGSFLL